jgi:hypothetical protein
MIARLLRGLRRRYYALRVVHFQREIAHLEDVRLRLAPALDRALRDLGNARVELVMLDIARPPVNRALGPGKRDGITRFSLLAANRRAK